jgi:hypothetical protein
MNYKKIEELFIDFILNIIGPNQERENERNNNLSIIQGIILNILTKKLPDYITHILPYGSFPIKTYLKDADIDITIFFESKLDHKVVIDIPISLIDKTILLIKEELEKHNKDSPFELISDIKPIMAGIRLLKCKIGSINIDISINNFSGLQKILFIDFIENQLLLQFNKNNMFNDNCYKENKINIFRRTLLLIKGWCFYEGKLMGSNIGLMASYTLEILVIFLFNLHYHEVNNEFEGFEKFFELMQQFDWEKNIISLYGILSTFNFYKKLQVLNNSIQNEIEKEENKNLNIMRINKPFWFLENIKIENEEENGENVNEIKTLSNKNNKPLLNLNEIIKFIDSLNSGKGNIHLLKEGNLINGANFDKFVNVLDPLNNHNNLGKSINYHSNSKMKLVIVYINKKLKKIQEVRKKANPFLYMNSLLNLFKLTLSTTYVELFANSLNTPEIIANSKIFKKFHKNEINKINIDKNETQKFNNMFLDSPRNDDSTNLEEEDFDEYVEEEDIEDDSENEEEEDKDEYEEETEKNNDKNKIDEDIDYKENLEIKENIIFEQIINNEIIKDLFEQNEIKQKNVKYNNNLLKQSKDYSYNLEKLLKEYNLI